MKVLIVKTSSLGDIIHTLPALTDAMNAIRGVRFDWVVEEAFAEIPAWHKSVDKVIPVALRRWRKNWFHALTSGQWRAFRQHLRSEKYDCVIDAQGLIKSALITRYLSAPKHGLNQKSAKESLASYFYSFKHHIPHNQHAVERTRQLFAKSLGYPLLDSTGKFDLSHENFPVDILPEAAKEIANPPYMVFLHGTTREDKHWPLEYWCELAVLAEEQGLSVLLPWGNAEEKKRADIIASQGRKISVLPSMSLSQMAAILLKSVHVVSVDSGLGHLAAALDIPCASLYGPTNPALIGTYGKHQIHFTPDKGNYSNQRNVEPAIFRPLTPEYVWSRLLETNLLQHTESSG